MLTYPDITLELLRTVLFVKKESVFLVKKDQVFISEYKGMLLHQQLLQELQYQTNE